MRFPLWSFPDRRESSKGARLKLCWCSCSAGWRRCSHSHPLSRPTFARCLAALRRGTVAARLGTVASRDRSRMNGERLPALIFPHRARKDVLRPVCFRRSFRVMQSTLRRLTSACWIRQHRCPGCLSGRINHRTSKDRLPAALRFVSVTFPHSHREHRALRCCC